MHWSSSHFFSFFQFYIHLQHQKNKVMRNSHWRAQTAKEACLSSFIKKSTTNICKLIQWWQSWPLQIHLGEPTPQQFTIYHSQNKYGINNESSRFEVLRLLFLIGTSQKHHNNVIYFCHNEKLLSQILTIIVSMCRLSMNKSVLGMKTIDKIHAKPWLNCW